MKVVDTKFYGLKLVKSKVYYDNRGVLKEAYKKSVLNKNLPFDFYSTSKKNVIRGLHIQTKKQQAKLISVLKGKILDVCVDLRKNSKTFGECFKIILSDKNETSIFIPEGFAHGFCAIEKFNLVYYKMSNYRFKNFEKGILWNDYDLSIKWPTNKPIISKKDRANMSLKKFLKTYKNL